MIVLHTQGQAGNAVQYITRNQALKKLQLRLSEFRCSLQQLASPQELSMRQTCGTSPEFYLNSDYAGVYVFSRAFIHESPRRRHRDRIRLTITSKTSTSWLMSRCSTSSGWSPDFKLLRRPALGGTGLCLAGLHLACSADAAEQ